MKSLKKLKECFGWIVLSFLIFTSTESFAQLKQMSARDLTEESTTVVYGRCSEVKSVWNHDQTIIYTYVTLVPEGYVKGNSEGETIITIPGGRVGDIIYEVSEMPVFETGEEVFTFLWKHPSGKNLVTGGYQGKLKIHKDPKTVKRMIIGKSFSGEDPTVKLKSLDAKSASGNKILLDDFINEVKGYLK